MRIAIVHTGDPRGPTGRIARDLAEGLAGRGHRITLIGGMHPPESLDGVEVLRAWRPPRVRGLDWYEADLDAAPGVLWHLLRGSFDVAHAFEATHAWAVIRAAPLGAPPPVLSLHDLPDRRYLVARRYRLEMLRAIVEGRAAITVPTKEAATLCRRYLMVDPVVASPAVATDRSSAGPRRALHVYEEIYGAAISSGGGR
jgi:Glycosyltransferase Family 4